MKHFKISHKVVIYFVLLLLASLAISVTPVAADQGAAGPSKHFAQGSGRDITRDDWAAHIPLMIIVMIIVIAVDGAFIAKIVLDRRKAQHK